MNPVAGFCLRFVARAYCIISISPIWSSLDVVSQGAGTE